MLPPYQPTPLTTGPEGVVDLRLEANAMAVPPQTHEHIGDKLDRRGVQWAWSRARIRRRSTGGVRISRTARL